MPSKLTDQDGWTPFLIVALVGLIGMFLVPRLGLDMIPEVATMAIIVIVVVVAYERFIGWG